MSKLHINIGDSANDRTGDPLRTAFDKVNSNFDELYARTGDDIQIPDLAGNTGKVLTTNGTTLSWVASSSTGSLKFVDNEMRTETYQNIKLTTDALGIVNKRSWIFYGDGALELPTSNLGVGTIQSPAGIWLNASGVLWQFNSNGAVDFPSVNGTTSLIRSANSTTINSNGKEWYFGQNGVLTLPGNGAITNPTSIGSPTGTIYTFANDGSATPGISSDNAVYLPSNVNSVSIQPGWIITFADSTQKTVVGASAGTGPDISKHILTFSGPVLKTGSEVWPLTVQSADYALGITTKSLELTPDGTTAWAFSSDGTLSSPNGATQQSTSSVNCQAGVDTVVYTSSQQGIQTIKLLLKVEGVVTVPDDADTQSCEMIVAKGFRGHTVEASVYGIVYTSAEPLATFTAEWNAVSSRVEVLCRPTSLTNSVDVKSFATEITTSD